MKMKWTTVNEWTLTLTGGPPEATIRQLAPDEWALDMHTRQGGRLFARFSCVRAAKRWAARHV